LVKTVTKGGDKEVMNQTPTSGREATKSHYRRACGTEKLFHPSMESSAVMLAKSIYNTKMNPYNV
jgi:hypothetical protein